MNIPENPIMLYSFINMKLRDQYPSLSELCAAMDIDEDELTAKLGSIGFEYSTEHNKFW